MSVSGNLTGSAAKSYMKYIVAKKERLNGQKTEYTNEWINEWNLILKYSFDYKFGFYLRKFIIFGGIILPWTKHIYVQTYFMQIWCLTSKIFFKVWSLIVKSDVVI